MQFYGMVNVIFYIPEDVLLIHGSPQGRRLFIDREISQSNPSYLEHLKKFSYALKIRNKYLKERNTTALEYTVYEKEFIEHGSYLMYFRQKYLQESSKLLQNLYSHLFDSEKKLQMRYKSSISFSKEMNILQIQECFQQEIQKKKEKEKEYGFSLLGPHKDDFCFLLNQEDARFFSSQGEKKSIIFSLKLAEIDMIYQEKKELPVLLIDDVTSYFDLSRRNNVLQFLKEKGVQVFLTSTEPLEIEGKHYYVEKGEVYDIPSTQTNGSHSSGMATE